MSTTCPLCDLPKPEQYRVCVYCHEAGRRLGRRRPWVYGRLNLLTVCLATAIVSIGFWKIFIAPARSVRRLDTLAVKPLSPAVEAKCAELQELYDFNASNAMRIKPGEMRVSSRISHLDHLRAQMKKLRCPGSY